MKGWHTVFVWRNDLLDLEEQLFEFSTSVDAWWISPKPNHSISKSPFQTDRGPVCMPWQTCFSTKRLNWTPAFGIHENADGGTQPVVDRTYNILASGLCPVWSFQYWEKTWMKQTLEPLNRTRNPQSTYCQTCKDLPTGHLQTFPRWRCHRIAGLSSNCQKDNTRHCAATKDLGSLDVGNIRKAGWFAQHKKHMGERRWKCTCICRYMCVYIWKLINCLNTRIEKESWLNEYTWRMLNVYTLMDIKSY